MEDADGAGVLPASGETAQHSTAKVLHFMSEDSLQLRDLP